MRAFNARDLEAWSELFHDDVVVRTESGTLAGRAAVRAFGDETLRAFPGVRYELHRIVAETADTIVVEYGHVNADPAASDWQLGGTGCDIHEVRDGRIATSRSYYLPHAGDRTGTTHLPSRTETAVLANEQAALRRVATLVARGVSETELFRTVTSETARLVGADATALLRFEPADDVTLVAGWAPGAGAFAVGEREPIDDALRAVREDGRPVRFGPAELPSDGAFVEAARREGIRTAVGVPITVDGRVWGVSFVAARGPEAFPADTEARIAGFTELVATAIANAHARTQLQSLVAEQAALRRVAVLVARAAQPVEIFAAVAEEVGRLLPVEDTAMLRYEPDATTTVVASWGERGHALKVGTRLPVGGENVTARVQQTGRPARIDDYANASGGLAGHMRAIGVRTAVGCPIVVDGRIWGVMVAAQGTTAALPAETESRVAQFTELTATAIANAASHAELTASRARVVTAADKSRRQIQRDLHDGAQQRLVHTIITLKQARTAAAEVGGPLADRVAESLVQAEQAIAELRELVRGMTPAAVERGGLRAGVDALVADMALPVRCDVLPGRLPAPVERTAYFVVAEALTNAVKHARARAASVRAELRDGVLEVEVRDDGAGGADAAHGSGLLGLVDRVAATGGSLALHSPDGGGTTLLARLPALDAPGSFDAPWGPAPAPDGAARRVASPPCSSG